jgi:hypothetical protein
MKPSDRGGLPVDQPLDLSEHTLEDWELLTESLSAVLGRRGIRNTHESRRAQENLPPDEYKSLRYYERWAVAAETLLVEKGLLTSEEIDARAAQIAARWGRS